MDVLSAAAKPRHPITRLAQGVAICLLPCLVAVFVAGTSFGAKLLPWKPGIVDLEVYLRAAHALLAGADPYNLGDSLPFLYPPFAAMLAVPLTWLPHTAVQIGWAVLVALTVIAILHRFGLQGWRLSLISAAAVRVVEPINWTVAFGQLGVFLVGLVVLDLVPGPRIVPAPRRGRWLPQGLLVGLATAIKLTPGLFVIYLLAIRRFKAAVVAIATMIITGVIALLVAPKASVTFWGRLMHGDTGLGSSIIYLLNQSVVGASTRFLGYNLIGNGLGLAVSVVAAVLGVGVAVRWHRLGDEAAAVTYCGLATLLASPVSWSHHFVWIAPLGMLYATRTAWPTWYRILGWLFVGWVVTAPYKFLPAGHDVELTYLWWQDLFGAVTPALGLIVLIAAFFVSRADRPGPQLSPTRVDDQVDDLADNREELTAAT
jgi:alpha-1,2-mannosyltransferase